MLEGLTINTTSASSSSASNIGTPLLPMTANAVGDSSLPEIGIGLDSCVIPYPDLNLFLIQSTDFFYPLIDDPYLMGKITCANVLSDLYAMGVVKIDNMLMLMAISQKMTESQVDIVVPLIIKGFKDLASEAGTSIRGGQTVYNPWMTIGGVASSLCSPSQFIMPDGGQVGDLLVLTKPIGTRVAINAYLWLDIPEKWNRISHLVNRHQVLTAYHSAIKHMSTLNINAAKLMHKYCANGATDITGFGLLGHAKNLASCQKEAIDFRISVLPVISDTMKMSDACGNIFNLRGGCTAETSGGLLIMIKKDAAEDFCSELKSMSGTDAWVIGHVTSGNKMATFADDITILDV